MSSILSSFSDTTRLCYLRCIMIYKFNARFCKNIKELLKSPILPIKLAFLTFLFLNFFVIVSQNKNSFFTIKMYTLYTCRYILCSKLKKNTKSKYSKIIGIKIQKLILRTNYTSTFNRPFGFFFFF